jgi:glutathione S-transferase
MRYELYYQPSIQGRGEFVRLSLEDAGADYLDVARDPNFGRPGIMKFLEDPSLEHPPFAPPFLKAGKVLISQTANILQFLAPRLGLVPKSEASRLWVHQLQLTIADWLYEPARRTIRSPTFCTTSSRWTKAKSAPRISPRCAFQNFSAILKEF